MHTPPSRRACLALASFLAGIAYGTYHSLLPLAIAATVASILLSLLPGAGAAARCCAFGLLIGCWYVGAWRTWHRPVALPGPAWEGTLVEAPDVRTDKILLTVRPDQNNPKGASVLVSAPRYPAYRYGDRIAVEGDAEAPEAFSGFDYPLYLERFTVHATVPRPRQIRLVAHDAGSPVIAALYRLRDSITSGIGRTLPEPESSFLAGVLLGSKRSIPQDVQDALRQTGTSHIIAISGANITIVLGLMLSALPVTGTRRQSWIAAALAVFITLLTGASASVMRGAAVACLSWYLKARSRRAWPTPLILSSMSLLCLGNPLLLVADPGFQLSFAAFGGLAYFGQACSQLFESWHFTRTLPGPVRSALAETTAATLGTAPLSIRLFGQLSLLGLLVNPLILWPLPAATLLGFLLILGNGLPWLAGIVAMPLWTILHAILSTVRYFGKWNVGSIPMQASWIEVSLIALCGYGTAYYFLTRHTREHT